MTRRPRGSGAEDPEGLRDRLRRIVGIVPLCGELEWTRAPYCDRSDDAQEEGASIWKEYTHGSVSNPRHDQRVGEGFTTESVRFAGMESDIVGSLRMPRPAEARACAVLCLHGHARGLLWGEECTAHYAVELARRGFITFSPDMYLFGSRRIKSYDRTELESGGQGLYYSERLAFVRLISEGRSLLGLHLTELIRCVDFLLRLPESNGQVVVMGKSMGGILAMWLAALDERVAGVVCAAGILGYRRIIQNGVLHCFSVIVPSLLSICDTPAIVSLIMPRALYAIHGELDAGFPIEGVKESIEAARATSPATDKLGQLVSVLTPGGHDVLTPDTLPVIYDWLQAHFGQRESTGRKPLDEGTRDLSQDNKAR